MTLNGPETDDVIGTEDPRATFEDFVEAAGPRLLAAARRVTGGDDAAALDLVAAALARARRRWRWLDRPGRLGRDPERVVLRMLARAAHRAGCGRSLDELEWAAAPEPAGAVGLLAAVRRRHERYVRRMIACGVAGVVVLAAAAWPVASALRGEPAHPRPVSRLAVSSPRSARTVLPGPGAMPGPFLLGPPVHRAPGTVLRDCESADNGQIAGPWRAQSVRAGPVWFIYARSPGSWPPSQRLAHGGLAGRATLIGIEPDDRAVVRVTARARARFRFLDGFTSDDVYTWGYGAPGLTLGGCPTTGLTQFWQGYISTLTCVPLVVQPLPHGRPVHVTLSAPGRPCPR